MGHTPDLMLSDYPLFTFLKVHVGGKNFPSREKLRGVVEKKMKGLAEEFFEETSKNHITTFTEMDGGYLL